MDKVEDSSNVDVLQEIKYAINEYESKNIIKNPEPEIKYELNEFERLSIIEHIVPEFPEEEIKYELNELDLLPIIENAETDSPDKEIIELIDEKQEIVDISNNVIPKIIFIVPYRNREEHLNYFKTHMKTILEDLPNDYYSICYIHQCDDRVFNRGAMKNIGFLMVKNKYPNDYQQITLVFNDVDSMPRNKNSINYETVSGVVKHFFGFTHTLGGIVSINARDFEMINGFPNFWAWGYEDNMIQQRVIRAGYQIDRSIFFKIGDPNIIHLNNTNLREVNQGEFERYTKNTTEGIHSIRDLLYTSDEPAGFVNVTQFSTEYLPNVQRYKWHDLKNGPIPYDTKFGLMYNNRRMQKRMRMFR